MATSSSGTRAFSRRELFNVWREKTDLSEKNEEVKKYILKELKMNDDDESGIEDIKGKIKNFTSQIKLRWNKHHYAINKFLEKESSWLDGDEVFPIITHRSHPKGVTGRPEKDFEQISVWSKRRKVSPLVQSHSMEELTFAASSRLYLDGRRKESKVVRDILHEADSQPGELAHNSSNIIKYTPEEALALFVDGRLTKRSYTLMQQGAKSHKADLYPTYKSISKAKDDCYPDSACCSITETCAEVTLQELIDHTTRRLLTALEMSENLQNPIPLPSDMTLIVKWGCDGSSSQSTYKQKFISDEDTDLFLFVVCLVPLQLEGNRNVVVWRNPTPSSTRYCRPIKIIFKKETKELIKGEVEKIEKQIATILPFTSTFQGKEIKINFQFVLSMLDGKTLSAITDTSTQSCAICGATPKDMNDIETLQTRINDPTRYRYGLSTLHAHIRSLEFILHLSYRLEIRQWQITSDKRAEVAERKLLIQNELNNQLGLLIDIPKQNYGTTNDGNTARRFFANYEEAARITGIDENLIRRLSVILAILSSGRPINIEAFRQYAKQTAKLFINMYPWYYMPSSIHRILIHGADIIDAATLPIGMLSEEAIESRNKDLRRFRQCHTRKRSRTANMTDLWHSLLYSSDPVITAISSKKHPKAFHKVSSQLDKEMKTLLLLSSDEEDQEESD